MSGEALEDTALRGTFAVARTKQRGGVAIHENALLWGRWH